MGLPLKAPLSHYDVIYTLPMMTIKEDKGQRSFVGSQETLMVCLLQALEW